MIAAEYGKLYSDRVDDDLFKYAVNNSNSVFIKFAFKKGLLNPDILHKKEIIIFLMNKLKSFSHTELIMNIMMFTDFRQWSDHEHLKQLISFCNDIVDPDKELNLMFCCYNPILCICLLAESMTRVGDAVNIFSYDCGVISDSLQNLGLKLVENMDDSIIESIFTEIDFEDRSVLKIICENEYELLMKDPKVSDLLDLLWVGK
jgi:hypothetical protein